MKSESFTYSIIGLSKTLKFLPASVRFDHQYLKHWSLPPANKAGLILLFCKIIPEYLRTRTFSSEMVGSNQNPAEHTQRV